MTSSGQHGAETSTDAEARSALVWRAFEKSVVNLFVTLEKKGGYRPDQPREPAGGPGGGRWTIGGAGLSLRLPTLSEARAAVQHASDRVQKFLADNHSSITRLSGLLQAAGGTAETMGGVTLVMGGAATSETGVGIGVAAGGAWMVANGYDNVDAGLRALATGEPQETNLHATLRGLGLSAADADKTELMLAAGTSGAAAARLSGTALEAAATRGLEIEAVRPFAAGALDVTIGGESLWHNPSIVARGEAWEAFDAERTGFDRTPPNFPVFDQISPDKSVAISNKTLDLVTPNYSRMDKTAVLSRLNGYTDQVADFAQGRLPEGKLKGAQLTERRLHVLMPEGEALPGQAIQISAAKHYAAQRNVVLKIEYAH